MKTILVIEDERTIRTNVLKILEYQGFEVLGAENGSVGIELARQYLPDLILCDVLMPDQDGFEVLQTLRADPETAGIPFIFLTAKADLRDVRRGMNLGADDYIPKPFTTQDLLQAIQVRLGKKEQLAQPYVDQMRQAAEALGRAAYVDLLTNLPNRIGLIQPLQQAIARAKHQSQVGVVGVGVVCVGVVCVNVDGFTAINRDYGYTVGDLLLQAIGDRLRAVPLSAPPPSSSQPALKESVPLVGLPPLAARLNADQFIVILAADSETALLTQIQELAQRLHQPYAIASQDLQPHFSLGLAIYPNDGDRPDILMAHAEIALRWGRTHGFPPGAIALQRYLPDIDADERERKHLALDLKHLPDEAQFFLLYQPQVNIITNRIIGVEAFLRWQHPQHGIILPQRFLALAQDTGLVDRLSAWSLRTACQQAVRFQDLSLVPVSVVINLSALQFQRPTLVSIVRQVVEETRLDPQLVVLEITENCLEGDPNLIRQRLQTLREIGVRISIDDFGMGHSSLRYLGEFPIDMLKIDRFFIQNIENPHYAVIVSSIVALAQALRLKVIAEGVETDAQLAILRKYGCHAMQGYFHSQPLLAQDMATHLQQSNHPGDGTGGPHPSV